MTRPFTQSDHEPTFFSAPNKSQSPSDFNRARHDSVAVNDSELHQSGNPSAENFSRRQKQKSKGQGRIENGEGGDRVPDAQVGDSGAPEAKEELVPDPVVAIGKVSSTTSPAGMPDRIPPRVLTEVDVDVSGYVAGKGDIIFSTAGASTSNGEVTIDGAATKVQNSTAKLKLKGKTQTAPGSAGNLQIVANQGGKQLATSNSFSVSSIPQNFSVSFVSRLTDGTNWGIQVNNDWESDSGKVEDLDEAKRSENVSYPSKTGVFATVNLVPNNSGYRDGHNPPIGDRHRLGPVETLRGFHGDGEIVANQVFTLKDNRTGAADIPVKNSGFTITKGITYNAESAITTLNVSKTGSNVTANGHYSDAGSGNASDSFPL